MFNKLPACHQHANFVLVGAMKTCSNRWNSSDPTRCINKKKLLPITLEALLNSLNEQVENF
jgi:hypothetical protein